MRKSLSYLSFAAICLSFDAFSAETLVRFASDYKSISSPMKYQRNSDSPTGERVYTTKSSSGSVTYNLELGEDSSFQLEAYVLANAKSRNAIGVSIDGAGVDIWDFELNSNYKIRKFPKIYSGKKGVVSVKLTGVDSYTRIAAIRIEKIATPPVEEPPLSEEETIPESPSDIIVKTSSELTSALSEALPGDVIRVRSGLYSGKFKAFKSGTTASPIYIIGESGSILDAGSMSSGYGLEIRGSNLFISRLEIRNAKKGIILDGVENSILENLKVYNTGEEGIHFRTHSSNNILRNSEIFDIGLKNASYGEGVYIGSSTSNWCTYTDCEIDKSDNNLILNNNIYRTTAEPMDIKEGTTGNIVKGNTMDGSKIQGANSADSFMDIKGNETMILDNTFMMLASNSKVVAGIQTHARVSGWGNDTVFLNNKVNADINGYAFEIDPKTSGSVVSCNNEEVGAALGLSNIACTQ